MCSQERWEGAGGNGHFEIMVDMVTFHSLSSS